MSNLEFTTTNTACDSCGRPSTAGFYHLHRGTPVLFDCVACVSRHTSQEAIQAAIEAHKEAAHLRMEREQEAAA
jgi:hypothetical protein